MNTKVMVSCTPYGNGHLVSSTPIAGQAVNEALFHTWPSPINFEHRRGIDLVEKFYEEETNELVRWHEPLYSRPESPDNYLKPEPQNFPKLTIIEDTDEEDEKMTFPHFKSCLANSQSKNRSKLRVKFSKSKQRKAVGDQRSKDATNSQKKTQKSLNPRLEIREDCEPNIIKGQRRRTQKESSRRNKSNPHGKKHNEETVKLDNKINPEQKKNTATVQTAVTENSQKEENEERIIITEQKREKQSLRKTRSGRLNLPRQLSPTRSTDTDILDTETKLPAVTENADDGDRAQKRKKPSQESETEESVFGEDATDRQKRTRKSLEPQLEIRKENEPNIIKSQRQRTPNKYFQKNNNALGKKLSEETVKLDLKINPEQKKNTATVQSAVTENRQNEKNERIVIAEQKEEKQSLRKTRSGRLIPSWQLSPNRSTDTANMPDITPEAELPAVTQNTDDDRRAEKRRNPTQEGVFGKDVTNNQKRTRKSLELQLESKEVRENNIIKYQRQSTQNEYSQRNKDNVHGKKQSEKPVKLDHKVDPKQKKNTATIQTSVTENRQNEENKKKRSLNAEQKQEKQSLSKTHSTRVVLSRLLSPNKNTDTANIQNIAPETELPAVTENTDEDKSAQKRKKPSQESQSEDSVSVKEGHTSTASRKRLLFSHDKCSPSITDVSINGKSPKKREYSYNYPFLEGPNSMSKEGASVQGRKSGLRFIKNKSFKKSQKIKKTIKRSKTAESTPKAKKQFNSKENDAGDLRRSKRTRVKPIAHWIGERICYRAGPDLCFEIVGIEPACYEEPVYRQRNNADSEHFVFSIPLQNNKNQKLRKVQLTNEGRRQNVECFSALRPEKGTEEFSKYTMLDGAVTEAGLIKLASSTKQSFQASPAHYVFFILKGHALVQVHDATQELKPGELFQVPKGISYSIENLSKKQMVLQFVMVK